MTTFVIIFLVVFFFLIFRNFYNDKEDTDNEVSHGSKNLQESNVYMAKSTTSMRLFDSISIDNFMGLVEKKSTIFQIKIIIFNLLKSYMILHQFLDRKMYTLIIFSRIHYLYSAFVLHSMLR